MVLMLLINTNSYISVTSMLKTHYLIIGGGIAGTTAADTIRKNDSEGSITIVSDEPYALYSRIMLSKPNFFLGKIPLDSIWLKKMDWYKKNSINIILGKAAAGMNVKKKTIALEDKTVIQYEKLLLAIGGRVRKWEVEGENKNGIYYLRNLDDGKAIISKIKNIKKAICIGGGFTSFEMCDILKLRGLEVTSVIREPFFWDPILDEPSGKMIEKALIKSGIKIIHNAQVKKVFGEKTVKGIELDNESKIPCDLIMVGIGITTECEWIKSAGIKTKRGILADEYLETNIQNVWTAGDCAEFYDLILDEQVQLGNWVNAQNQGRIAGLNMAGKREPFQMVSFYTTQGFGITIGFTGDVRSENREVIKRGSPESNSYGRIIVDDHDELIGATFINRTQELGPISKLIEKEVKVKTMRKELEDSEFDLNKLL